MSNCSGRLSAPAFLLWSLGLFATVVLASLIISAARNSPPAPAPTVPVLPTSTPPPLRPSATLDATPALVTPSPLPTVFSNPTPTPAPVTPTPRLLENWKDWPVIPVVSSKAIEIYRRGLEQGTDPHVFSVLGDCQSLPETFMGTYDTQPAVVAALSPELKETILNFSGSFSRPEPTTKSGSTAAAMLWFAWHENKYGCQQNETPLDCELRLANPSIAFINLGTHYETRNIDYLRKVIEKLIAHGTLPILATKADNRELDDRLNLEMAQLALEYDLPLWNFYAAVNDFPDHGVSVKAGDEHLGVIYLVPAALERHRLTALQALDAVWRGVK